MQWDMPQVSERMVAVQKSGDTDLNLQDSN